MLLGAQKSTIFRCGVTWLNTLTLSGMWRRSFWHMYRYFSLYAATACGALSLKVKSECVSETSAKLYTPLHTKICLRYVCQILLPITLECVSATSAKLCSPLKTTICLRNVCQNLLPLHTTMCLRNVCQSLHPITLKYVSDTSAKLGTH